MMGAVSNTSSEDGEGREQSIGQLYRGEQRNGPIGEETRAGACRSASGELVKSGGRSGDRAQKGDLQVKRTSQADNAASEPPGSQERFQARELLREKES
ncbi:hypothetical protein Scep_007862 [Stephania cephalantha]|uniref:Uncharacterized protein n=1 Tax=Stephania cephalantha TaxID=152367 RepID=A0AAP0KBW7_9MAGN